MSHRESDDGHYHQYVVIRQPLLDAPSVAAVYAYVEPVIPFASLTPAA